MPKLQYTTTDGSVGEVELTAERLTVGRADDNSIVIPDNSVSSHHAEISNEGSAWMLTDLGSTNGTKIQGERVEAVNMSSTRSFTLGSVDCVFVADAPAARAGGGAGWDSPARSSTVSSGGYAAQPYDRSQRAGFGPHKKVKDSQRGMLMLLGVLGLVACAGAVAMFMNMGA